MIDCETALRALREEHGTSEFDRAVKKMMKERLSNYSREKRKQFPERVRLKIYGKQGARCQICGDHIPDIKLMEIDHVDPNRQDFNTISNLQGLCRGCNREKGAKSVMAQTKFYGKTAKEILNPEDDI